MLGLNGVLVRLLASAAPVASQGVWVGTELAYFFRQLEREAPVYL